MMASQPAPILWVSPFDPWSRWTLSGITREVCCELNSRGRLLGALSAKCPRPSRMHRPPSLIASRLHRFADRFNPPQGWARESKGVVGDILKQLPEMGTAVYQFVCPEVDPALKLRRFRFMDLSISDATRTGAYGHGKQNETDYEERYRIQKKLLDASAGVLALSTHAADAIARDFDFPRDQITPVGAGPAFEPTIKPGYDAERYAAARILFVGFNWERKGGPLLLEAFRIVRDKIPHATLHVVGPPKRPTDEAGVRWTPPINKGTQRGRLRLEQIFAEASVFCMPSMCETWGLVYVEAQQMGTPIVGFREWAVPDIIEEGATGMFSSERTAESLAESIIEALLDADRLKVMGRAATHRMRDVFAWPRVVDRIVYGLSADKSKAVTPALMQADSLPQNTAKATGSNASHTGENLA